MAPSAKWEGDSDVSSGPDDVNSRSRSGRAPSTTRDELSKIALVLFSRRGFDETTIGDIAATAGIGRRTFFRYYDSKNDLPWGDFDELLVAMRRYLDAVPPEVPLLGALRSAVIEFNRVPPDELPVHRERMRLILTVPALQAHSTLRYAAWREVVADYAAVRLRYPSSELEPQSIGWACLGLCLAAYEHWLLHEEADLLELLDRSFARLEAAFAGQNE